MGWHCRVRFTQDTGWSDWRDFAAGAFDLMDRSEDL